MASFSYKVIDQSQKIITGTVAAQNKEEAAQILTKKGYTLIGIQSIKGKETTKGTIPAIDKIIFCRYLSTMLASGLSLSEGVEVLREETKHPLMKKILGDISYSLEQGQQLSTVFERYPAVFEPYFLTLTRAGEVSGKLVEVLKYLETELRAAYSLKSKIKGALLYPMVVFVTMIGIGFSMFFFVLPQIGKVFLNLNLPLPVYTKFLFTSSIVLSQYTIPIVVGTIIGIVLFVFGLKKQRVRDGLFKLIKPIPTIRNLIKKIDMARFNRIFSTLLKSAVPITEALEISLESLAWYEYRMLSKSMPDNIRKGKSLANAVKETHIFPVLMIQMIQAGEKTGTLDVSLSDLATFYEEEVEEELKGLTQIIEPVLMLIVGIAVGAMILSIIAPIYGVVGSFQEAAGGKGPAF